MQSAIAFGIFIAIVGYFITRSEDKKKEEEQKKINDRINDSRSMLKDSIVKRAAAFNVTDYTNEELEAFIPETQAQKIAKMRIMRAVRDDDKSLAETKEITDRTEGKTRQYIGIETDEKAVPIIRGFVIPTLPDGYIDKHIAKAR